MSEIHRIKCGNGNCYIIENGVDGILVDTGKKEFVNRVMEACRQYHVKLIVLTHAHFDHAENAAQISSALDIPIGMSEKDCNLIQSNANQGLSAETFFGKIVLSVSLKDFSVRTLEEFKPDIFLEDGDSLQNMESRPVLLPCLDIRMVRLVLPNKQWVKQRTVRSMN